ncbi:TOMM precursor leader peptide-binding protein [Streptacidiphilus sp. PAMC 29251]
MTETLPWEDSCAAFGERVRAGLSRHRWTGTARSDGPAVEVTVRPWGVRDELAVPAGTDPATGRDRWSAPIGLDGGNAVVGPVLPPGGGGQACARCVARRWQLVRHPQVREALEHGAEALPVGAPPLLTPFAADTVTALVIGELERQRENEGEHRSAEQPLPFVHLVRLADLTVQRVRLVADSQCPDCGRPWPDDAAAAEAALSGVGVDAVPKRAGGGFRGRSVDDYDLPLDGYLNPVCGVLGQGASHEFGLTTTSAVMGCIAERADDELYEIYWGGHAESYRGSLRIGLFEGLERYAGVRPRDRQVSVRASLDALGGKALDPRDCGLYSEEFHRRRPDAPVFSSSVELPWVWGYSLRDRRPVLVPQVLAYYHSATEADRFVQECSSGCASGSSLTEAAYCGLMELIERDAFLLAWYGRLPLPELDPSTSTRLVTRQLVDRLALYGYRARFFDTGSTFPVPVITGVAVRQDGGLGALCFGAGAGLDPEDALSAALAEIATDATQLATRVGYDEPRLRAMVEDFGKVTGLHDHPILFGLPEMAEHADFLLGGPPRPPGGPLPVSAVRGADGPAGRGPGGSADLGVDLADCVRMLAAAGHDTIVVDQTIPEQRRLGLHTAAVIVPGLLPIDFGWHRQRALHLPRMRTAPMAAGLRERELTAADLNPVPHPFP